MDSGYSFATVATLSARIRELEAREAEAWALLTDVRFSGRNGLHDDIDKWLAAYRRADR